MKQLTKMSIFLVMLILCLSGCSSLTGSSSSAASSQQSKSNPSQTTLEDSSVSNSTLEQHSEEILLLGKPITEIDFSQAIFDAPIPSSTNEIAEYVNTLYKEFLSAIGGFEYPDGFLASGNDGTGLIAFAFARLQEGWNGEDLNDYPTVEHRTGATVHVVPSQTIANCVNEYFDGINAYEWIQTTEEWYNPQDDTVTEPTGLGGGFTPYAIADVQLKDENVLIITVYEYYEGILETATDIETPKHHIYQLSVQFFDDHYCYQSYVKTNS